MYYHYHNLLKNGENNEAKTLEKKKQIERERKTTRDRISASLFECTKRKIKADLRTNEKNICCQTFEISFPKTRERKRGRGGERKKKCAEEDGSGRSRRRRSRRKPNNINKMCGMKCSTLKLYTPDLAAWQLFTQATRLILRGTGDGPDAWRTQQEGKA